MLYYFQHDPRRIYWLDTDKRLIMRKKHSNFINGGGFTAKVSVPLECLSSRDYRWNLRKENVLSLLVNSKDF